jgi:hypothetical protein
VTNGHGLNRATLSLQYNAAGNHSKDAILAHEAVFEKNHLLSQPITRE